MTAHQDPTANPTGDPSLDKSAEQGAAQGSSDATAHAEAQPLDPIAQLQAELVTAQAQLSEHKDQVLRAHAEMENVRRRAQDEVSKARKFGIAPSAGTKFDPHQHQAIATVPAEQEPNTVVQTLQKGYLIAERVLRPALVTVSS